MAGAVTLLRRPAAVRAHSVQDREPDFRALLGETAWARLPGAVQARFALGGHAEPLVYPGRMTVRASAAGWILGQVCRLLGTPLAPWTGEDVAVDVTVGPHPRGGIDWSRLYRFAGHAPVRVASRKLVDETGALLEVVRGGLGLRLAVNEEDGALVFRSRGYVLRLGRRTLPLPTLLSPGFAWVEHRDLGGGAFRFSLRFQHPWLGETIFQTGVFHDPV
ncbi:DUF4166 domain-containing protein [Caulobacter sp. KR2-114]|uniref:DUF4166 domain-containing protein n=1 Tax=Caulobacter sp. KR2-114 TaxID=3400912 RepID=UPI003C0E34B4